MASPVKESLSAADLAWWHIQTENNLSVSTVVLTLDRPIDIDCLKDRVEDRLMAIDRFRQRVEPSRIPLGRPVWRESEDFALSDHLVVVEPEMQQAPDNLERLVGELLGRPLEPSRPLWQLFVIDDIAGSSAIVARVHQSIADGTLVPRLVLRVADPDGSNEVQTIGLEPSLPAARLLERAQTNTAHTRMLCRLISARADTISPLRAPLTPAKTAAWSQPASLAPLRDRAAQLDVSVTDILLAAVAGALRFELHHRDTPVENIHLRAIVPIDLRSTGELRLGTRMAMARLEIPVAPPTATARLAATRQALARCQRSPEAFTVLGAVPNHGISMSEIEERTLRLLGTKATTMVAFHPGPQSTARLCGQSIKSVIWWPALSGELPLAVSIVAYTGTVLFGVAGERSLVNARGLVDRICRALDQLLEPN